MALCMCTAYARRLLNVGREMPCPEKLFWLRPPTRPSSCAAEGHTLAARRTLELKATHWHSHRPPRRLRWVVDGN
jgi:hypothetical protein